MMKRFNNIIANQTDYEQLKYYLENNTPPPEIKYASELLLWNGGDNDTEITMERALQLNKVERNQNDIVY